MALTADISINTTTSTKGDGHVVTCSSTGSTLADSSSTARHICRWTVTGPGEFENVTVVDPRPGRTNGDSFSIYSDMQGWVFAFIPTADGTYTVTMEIEDTVSGTTDETTAEYVHSAPATTTYTFGTGSSDYATFEALTTAQGTNDNILAVAEANFDCNSTTNEIDGDGWVIDGAGYECEISANDGDGIQLKRSGTQENITIRNVVFVNSGTAGDNKCIGVINSVVYQDILLINCSIKEGTNRVRGFVEYTQGADARMVAINCDISEQVQRYGFGIFGDVGGGSLFIAYGCSTPDSIEEWPIRCVSTYQAYAYLQKPSSIASSKHCFRIFYCDYCTIDACSAEDVATSSHLVMIGGNHDGVNDVKGLRISRCYYTGPEHLLHNFGDDENNDNATVFDDVVVTACYYRGDSSAVNMNTDVNTNPGDVYVHNNTFIQDNNSANTQFVAYEATTNALNCTGNLCILGYEGVVDAGFKVFFDASETDAATFSHNVIPPNTRHTGDRVGRVDSTNYTQATWLSTISSSANFVDLAVSDLESNDFYPNNEDSQVTITSEYSGVDYYGNSFGYNVEVLAGAVLSEAPAEPSSPPSANSDISFTNLRDQTTAEILSKTPSIVQKNTTYFEISDNGSGHTSTLWEIRRLNGTIVARVTTSGSGFTPALGTISGASKLHLDIQLDRQHDYEMRFRPNNGSFSSWQSIDLSGEIRAIGSLHRDTYTETRTSRGSSISHSNPKYTIRRTSRGISIVPNFYENNNPRNRE